MGAAFLRNSKAIAVLYGASSSLLMPVMAFAQPLGETLYPTNNLQSLMLESAPMAFGAGALGFAVVAAFWVVRTRRETARQLQQSQHENARLRAKLDESEALLSTSGEVTILWAPGTRPKIFGEMAALFPAGGSISALLNFSAWITPDDAKKLKACLARLDSGGHPFEENLVALDGRTLGAIGRAIGGATSLCLRIVGQTGKESKAEALLNIAADQEGATENSTTPVAAAAIEDIKAVLAVLEQPSWIRDKHNALVFANQAYLELASEMGLSRPDQQLPEIFPASQIAQHRCELERTGKKLVVATQSEALSRYKISLSFIKGVIIGSLIGASENSGNEQNTGMVHIGGIINALTTPVAVFDRDGGLTQFNSAYAQLWRFDDGWLQEGTNERAIIDRLRRRDLLPSVPDYQAWRKRHFKYYSSLKSWEDCWHLPDGRAINVIAAPASREGGMVYVFEDVSERLKLVSTNKSLINVQRETLNALSEGVAVFSTDGRLRLHNPRLSAIWKLPMNELGLQPHINKIAQACGRNLSVEGEEIWLKLKQFIVDLNPSRSDKSGRVSLSEGRLIDYAIVRLGDSQTMLTFVDVTRSAQYEQVLKERNDALITADRLKDAFIQNVSYELRSPLTNIIGFADLLASDSFGELNEQQRAYTDYIRASSTTLGILIDNILDLTHVDAGIAELDLQNLDIVQLIEKAKAGLAASFAGVNSEQKINLKLHLPEKPPALIADGARVVQILYNLLSNAARFSTPGARVDLTIEARGDWVRFVVDDEGAGVPDEMVAALLQRFEGQSVKGRQRGAGLGLAIVNAFVELHGGNLKIEARQPAGTRVIVNLPADATPYVVSPARALIANNDEQ